MKPNDKEIQTTYTLYTLMFLTTLIWLSIALYQNIQLKKIKTLQASSLTDIISTVPDLNQSNLQILKQSLKEKSTDDLLPFINKIEPFD